MEIGLETAMPTYAGGLGLLAGDTVRAAADMGVPMVAVTLVYRKGFFRQRLDAEGNQQESASEWIPEQFLEPLPQRVSVEIEGRTVCMRAWLRQVTGEHGRAVPVYFLDTNLPENAPGDRALTDDLYGGDGRYRLCQEAILGIGGVAMLRSLGFNGLHAFHMNEGHAALLAIALLEEEIAATGVPGPSKAQVEAVQRSGVFTTHTPVAAGHDRFPIALTTAVLGERRVRLLEQAGFPIGHELNMSELGFFFSRYANGVSMRHAQISKQMFPAYDVRAVTNGVHGATWAAPSFAKLFDRYVPGWRTDNRYLRYAVSLPLEHIQQAHAEAKADLIREVRLRTGVALEQAVLTIGFARRATGYKRGDLIFSDVDRLRRIVQSAGPIQFVYAGKAHPRDESGKEIIRRVYRASAELGDLVKIAYLEDYDMTLGKLMTTGVDLWVNNPQRPMEASGTSGMKAALNGIPSFSVLDGWWIEGHVEGITGWSIAEPWDDPHDYQRELASLYDKLEFLILPAYYRRPREWAATMRSAIVLNGSFFNAHRMLSQYVENAYAIGVAPRLSSDGNGANAKAEAALPQATS
ncbi:MAG: alpha-glucan family phosphorylase [Chloroflexi bacterium]|nr:alpha-glucan family phosphorylase [Chloroflexota bacterium]